MANTVATLDMKSMRKGTRSCRECRRRKIKCTWTFDHSRICSECTQHKRQCISQGHVLDSSVNKKPNLKIRIGKLESIIERLAKDHTQEAIDVISETDSSHAGSTSTDRSLVRNEEGDQPKVVRSPLLDLFENDVLQRRNGYSAAPETSIAINFGSPGMSDRDKILSTIADDPNIMDVLDVAGAWWLAWDEQYPGNKYLRPVRSLKDTVKMQLADENPVVVATGLLGIVMSLQYIRVGVDDHELHLSTIPTQLIERITVAVDQVVLSKDAYIESMEGVQALILKAKQHAEINQLRKSWLRIRQSIKTAQKIDLASLQPGMSPAEFLGRQKFVGSLFETDRFMSLLLGLPYALDDNFTDKLATRVLADSSDIVTRMRALRRIAAIASGRINDRNASSDPISLAVTTSIQEMLNSAARSMPATWWDITAHSESLSDPMATHEHLMAQLWFYQTQSFLQLPFMLRAASEHTFEYNRVLCLNSCRNLIRIFNVLRQNATLSGYTCKCEDFQGLLGAIVLLVGLLQYSSQGMEPTGSSFDIDLDIIDVTKNTFQYASQQQGGAVAKQGLHVLETLSNFLEDDGSNPIAGADASRIATLFVPYFGTISVKSGPNYRPANLNREGRSNELLDRCWQHALCQMEPSSNFGNSEAIPVPEMYGQTDTGPVQPVQQYTNAEIQFPEFDWDKIMLGNELEQDWTAFPNDLGMTSIE